MPAGRAKDTLSALADEAKSMHEIITVTRHGHPATAAMSADNPDFAARHP